VWFTPTGPGKNYISFILVLVSTLALTAGTIDGLLALLFFRAELNALREFEWEVRNACFSLLPGGGGGDGEGGDGDDGIHGDGDDGERDGGERERGW
jgi:sphingomyelin phosphodiesterase 2